MSLINQMLQDLEKRHPRNAVGDVLPAQVTAVAQRHALHPAKWAPLLLLALLVIGLSTGLLLLRPSAPDMVSVASPTSVIPAVSATPYKPVSVQSLSVNGGQTQSLPSRGARVHHNPSSVSGLDSSSVTAVPHSAHDKNGSIPTTLSQTESQPAPSPVTPTLLQSSMPTSEPTPETVAPVTQSLHQPDTTEKERQRTAHAPSPHLPDSPLRTSLQETSDATTSNKQIKEITPSQQAENEYRKALELLQHGRTTRAIERLTQALQLDASHIMARQAMVGLLVESKRFDEAEHWLQEGLNRLDPDQPGQPGLAMILARLQVERGDTHAGLETLQRSLPDAMAQANHVMEQADYQAFLAALLQREGRHGEAIKHYLQALRKTPQSGIWLMGIGISLQAENRLQEAQEAFKRAKVSNTLSPDLQAFVEQRLRQIKQQP